MHSAVTCLSCRHPIVVAYSTQELHKPAHRMKVNVAQQCPHVHTPNPPERQLALLPSKLWLPGP